MTGGKTKKLVQFGFLSAMFIWAGFAYADLGVYMHDGILFARVLNGRPYVSDFVNVYNSAILADRCRRGEKINIYDMTLQNESVKKLIAPVVPEEPFFLQYPPHFFALNLPLAAFPMPAAWLLWNLCGIVLSVFALFKLAGAIEFSADKKKTITFMALAFSSFPAWLSVELGQTSLFLVSALTLMLYFLKRRKHLFAGFAAGFLTLKLQYIPFFGLIGLFSGRVQFIAGGIACLVALGLVSLAILGLPNILNYPHALLSGETGKAVSGVSSHMMQNLRGQLVLWSGGDKPVIFKSAAAIFLLSLIPVGLLNWKARFSEALEGGGFEPVWALTIMSALLFSPHTHTQDYVLLFVASMLLWKWLSSGQRTGLRRAAIRWLIMLFPGLSWFLFFLQPLFMYVGVQPFFIYLVIITILVLLENMQAGKSAESV